MVKTDPHLLGSPKRLPSGGAGVGVVHRGGEKGVPWRIVAEKTSVSMTGDKDGAQSRTASSPITGSPSNQRPRGPPRRGEHGHGDSDGGSL